MIVLTRRRWLGLTKTLRWSRRSWAAVRLGAGAPAGAGCDDRDGRSVSLRSRLVRPNGTARAQVSRSGCVDLSNTDVCSPVTASVFTRSVILTRLFPNAT